MSSPSNRLLSYFCCSQKVVALFNLAGVYQRVNGGVVSVDIHVTHQCGVKVPASVIASRIISVIANNTARRFPAFSFTATSCGWMGTKVSEVIFAMIQYRLLFVVVKCRLCFLNVSKCRKDAGLRSYLRKSRIRAQVVDVNDMESRPPEKTNERRCRLCGIGIGVIERASDTTNAAIMTAQDRPS